MNNIAMPQDPSQMMSQPGGEPQIPNFYDNLHQMAIAHGMNALQSGRIDMKRAAQEAKKLGVGDPSVMDRIIKGDKKEFDYTMGGGMSSGAATIPQTAPTPVPVPQPAAAPHPLGMGPQRQPKVTDKKPNELDLGNAEKAKEFIENSDEFKAAKEGANGLEDRFKNALAMEPESNQWIKPLAAYADYVSGTAGRHGTALSGFNPAGMTDAQKSQALFKYQDEIQKRKEDLAKALIQGIGGMNKNTGSTTTVIGDQLGGLGSARIEALRQKASTTFDNDKILMGVAQTQNAFKKATGLLTGSEPLTKYDMDLLQKDVIDGTSKTGNAAQAQVGRETMNTLWDLFNKAGVYGGRIADLRKAEPQVFDHIMKKIMQLQKENADINDGRVDELHVAFKNSPYPGIPETAEEKVNLLKQKSHQWRQDAVDALNKKEAPAPKGGGKTALKNPEDMSVEELKAELANGGK